MKWRDFAAGRRFKTADGQSSPAPTPRTLAPRVRTAQDIGIGRAGRIGKLGSWFLRPEVEAALDRETQSSTTTGNHVNLLVNGVASQAQRLNNIRTAHEVFLKTYIIREDETWADIRKALMARVKARRPVYLQYDYKGYYGARIGHLVANWVANRVGGRHQIPRVFAAMLAEAKAAGCERFLTIIPSQSTRMVGRDHEKYLVTWRRGEPARAIMGGMNVGDEWAFGGDPNRRPAVFRGLPGLRDTDVEVRGPAVQQILSEFVFDAGRALKELRHLRGGYDAEKHQRLLHSQLRVDRAREAYRSHGSEQVRFIANRPEQKEKGQYIEKLYIELLGRVPKGDTVTLVSPFFLPTDRLLDAIKSAAERGVKFVIVQNHNRSAEAAFRIVARAARDLNRRLLRDFPGQIKVFYWAGNERRGLSSSHQKIAQFGVGGPILFGSSNLDARSLVHNTEGAILVHGAGSKLAAQVARMFQSDWSMNAVYEASHESFERDPWFARLFQSALRRLGRNYL
ncbi:MAG: phosphatidylserine/phosphatidylglycerophosphate/cardiolipin synthase family protein [Deltaproteobacteria bacterium]|nr:phosphatidylserine/phosphatidylglycerophosphate/cardiolipin synthase family protein [Deltaproteobacteria bacterium]